MRNSLLTYVGLVLCLEPLQASSSAFLAACGTEEKRLEYFVDGKKCTHGIALKEPLSPGCVCLKGVWIIQTEICGSKPIIIMGKSNEDCYFIKFNITSLLHLGDPIDLFRTQAWVAPYHLTAFKEIPLDGTWTPYLDFDNPVVVAINPKDHAFEAEDDTNCFRKREIPPRNKTGPVIHLWLSDLPTTRYRTVKKCIDPLGSAYDETATVGGFYYHGDDDFNLPIKGCPNPCDLLPDGRLKPRTDERRKRTWKEFLEEYYENNQANFSSRERDLVSRLKNGIQFKSAFDRRKRALVNCEMVWEGSAYCLKSYWEPLEKIPISEKDKKLCYPPQSAPPPKKLRRYG